MTFSIAPCKIIALILFCMIFLFIKVNQRDEVRQLLLLKIGEAITKLGAKAKSSILLSQEWNNISHFEFTNNIFIDCIELNDIDIIDREIGTLKAFERECAQMKVI